MAVVFPGSSRQETSARTSFLLKAKQIFRAPKIVGVTPRGANTAGTSAAPDDANGSVGSVTASPPRRPAMQQQQKERAAYQRRDHAHRKIAVKPGPGAAHKGVGEH